MLEDSRMTVEGSDTSDPFDMLLDEELEGEEQPLIHYPNAKYYSTDDDPVLK